jgi:hypothetical protein
LKLMPPSFPNSRGGQKSPQIPSFKGAAPLSSRARKRPPLKSRQSTLLIPNTNTQQNHLSLRLTHPLACFAQSDSKDSTCSAINSSEDHPRTNDRNRSHARYLDQPNTHNSKLTMVHNPRIQIHASIRAATANQSNNSARPQLQLNIHTPS